MLLLPTEQLTVLWVMAAQALSGIAKDLNKMSAKSAIKLLLPDEAQGALYKWVALLTGSKNALKGVGFFLGGVLLAWLGFQGAMAAMAGSLLLVWVLSLVLLKQDLGKKSFKPKFTELLSKSASLNWLSAARFCLFASRDVWFVIALPLYLASIADWSQSAVGAFLASWVIAYGIVQAFTPKLTLSNKQAPPTASTALNWVLLLALLPWLIGVAMLYSAQPLLALLCGLLLYCVFFAINSSLHSYLIVASANRDGVSLDVGFYYMANAAGRLAGTLLSGWAYQSYGLVACLWLSGLLLLGAVLCTWRLKLQ
ncbi:organoarsenical effux MFS transporter ArsJ, partial [Alishewanella sp. SMS9]|nr:organoarsenical effux MFS transporter ArsJ [Alishewanella sp. SMS9]